MTEPIADTANPKGAASLAQRLQRVEDMLAIYELISSYGPAVDSDCCEEAAKLWTEDGRYEIPGIGHCNGRREIQQLFEGEMHQALIMGGAAHVLSMPHVRLDGDTAVATHYAQVFVPQKGKEGNGAFGIYRTVATRWELVRTDGGWKCKRRINHLLDGRSEARELLAQGVSRKPGS